MRSRPPRRISAATAHHCASESSCNDAAENSCAKLAANASQPSSSQRLTTSGQRPVEPTVPHTPKQSMLRSARPIGPQFAVMWCMYRARFCPMMSTNSWM